MRNCLVPNRLPKSAWTDFSAASRDIKQVAKLIFLIQICSQMERRGLEAILIEVRQDLIGDETGIAAWAERLARAMKAI